MKMNILKKQFFKIAPLALLTLITGCTTESETINIDPSISSNFLEGDSVSISNPGFEEASEDWNGNFAMSGDEHTGSNSAKLPSSSRSVSQVVNVKANTNYILSAYILDGGTLGVNASGLNEETSGVYEDWTKVSVIFNSGSNTSITIFGEYYDEEGRFDDFELIEGANSGGSTATPPSTSYIKVPAKIEAESYSDATEGRTETTSDNGGGLNIGWINEGEFMEYGINVPSAGAYTLDFRVASRALNTSIAIYANNNLVGNVSEPSTGGWQNWTTTSTNVNLPSGNVLLRIVATGSSWNFNWFEVKEVIEISAPSTPPNPTGDSAEEILGKYWKISLPVDEDGNGSSTSNTSYSGRNTDAYEPKPFGDLDSVANNSDFNQWFWVDGGEVFFRAFCGGATTSGSGYPRSELRGLDTGLNDGSSSNFDMDDYQELDVTVRVVDVPSNIPEVNMVQIHGPDDEPLRVEYRDDSDGLHLTVNEDDEIFDVIDYQIGQRLKVNVVVENGRIYVTLNNLDNGDSYEHDFQSDDDTGYWKVGAYLQSSYVYCSFKGGDDYCKDGGENDDYNATGTVAVSNLSLTRDGVRIH